MDIVFDINKIESLILPEWEEYYINYKSLIKILSNLKTNKQNFEKIDDENNINNYSLKELLLENNEQNEEENKKMEKNDIKINEFFEKYITQLNLELNKISFFDNLLQNQRHKKRYDEIIEQLKYIENNETIKIFKKQLIKSLINLYRDISNYDNYYINVNMNIMNNIIYSEENKIFDEIELNKDYYQTLKQKKEEFSSFFSKAKEFNTKFLSEISEQYTYFSDQENINDSNIIEDILNNNNLPNLEKLHQASLKLKIFRLSFIIMIILLIKIPNLDQ